MRAGRGDLGLTVILPVVFLEPLKLYVFSLAVMAFLNLYFQQFHYTAPRGVCVCVCAHARLFLGFVVLLELLLDVSPMFWKPASLHLLKHSAPSPSPPLWTVIHSKHTPCSWVSLYIYIFSLLFSLWILPSL